MAFRRSAGSNGFSTTGAPVSSRKSRTPLPSVSPVTKKILPSISGYRVAQFPVQSRTVQFGHPQVADDQIVGLIRQPLQGLGAVLRDVDGVSVGFQHLGQGQGDLRIVIDDQQPQRSRASRRFRLVREGGGGGGGAYRQFGGEGGAAARRFFQHDRAAMAVDDVGLNRYAVSVLRPERSLSIPT